MTEIQYTFSSFSVLYMLFALATEVMETSFINPVGSDDLKTSVSDFTDLLCNRGVVVVVGVASVVVAESVSN